jgi:hypothetical protein
MVTALPVGRSEVVASATAAVGESGVAVMVDVGYAMTRAGCVGRAVISCAAVGGTGLMDALTTDAKFRVETVVEAKNCSCKRG